MNPNGLPTSHFFLKRKAETKEDQSHLPISQSTALMVPMAAVVNPAGQSVHLAGPASVLKVASGHCSHISSSSCCPAGQVTTKQDGQSFHSLINTWQKVCLEVLKLNSLSNP